MWMDLLGREAKGVGYPNPKDTPNSILYLQEKQHRRRAVAYFWINGQTDEYKDRQLHEITTKSISADDRWK